jgi:hypothetical protein
MIRITEEFTGPFSGSVRGDGLDIEVLFLERDPLVFSINRGGGGKNEVFDSVGFAGFQEDDRSTDVHILIEKGLDNGRSHPGPGRQVDDEINPVFLEDPFNMIGVSNISCNEFKEIREFLSHPFCILNFYIGIIEAVKVVEANDRDPIA